MKSNFSLHKSTKDEKRKEINHENMFNVVARILLSIVIAAFVAALSSAYILFFKIAAEDDSTFFLVAAWVWLAHSIVMHVCVFFVALLDGRTIGVWIGAFSYAIGAFIVNNLVGWAIYSYIYSSFIE